MTPDQRVETRRRSYLGRPGIPLGFVLDVRNWTQRAVKRRNMWGYPSGEATSGSGTAGCDPAPWALPRGLGSGRSGKEA